MFKPSYLSAQGPYGAYGADAPASEAAKEETIKDSLYKMCDEKYGDDFFKRSGCKMAVGAAALLGEAALKKAACEWFDECSQTTTTTTPTTTTPRTPTMSEKFKAQMTAEEYALWLSTVKAKYGPMPIPLTKGFSGQKLIAWMNAAQKEGDAILAKRYSYPQDKKAAGLTTEEPNYTWYYVGGVAALAAVVGAGWYFGIYRPKHK